MTFRICLLSALACIFGFNCDSCRADAPKALRVYIGTYTGPQSRGIYTATLDVVSGRLDGLKLAAETGNPSFVAIDPSKKYLYCVSEVSDFNGKKTGAVSAYEVDQATGGLTFLNQQSSEGAGPCHLVVDASGKNVLVANYGGGSIAVLPIQAGSGRLEKATAAIQHSGSSADKQRQEAPHAHSINLDSANRFAFVADLGLDKVMIYRFDPAAGSLTPNDPAFATVADGSGPRHFAFHPSGKFAFVNNEMTSSIMSFRYDSAKGALTLIETLSTLPNEVKGNSTAEIVVHPSGKFVYVSNRGHDSIAKFQFDEASGNLKVAGHTPTGGKTPRNFNVDPSGQILVAANQSTNDITCFRINKDTGDLTPVGEKLAVGSPVCIRFMPLKD